MIRTVRTNWGGIEINATGPVAFSFLGVLSGLGVSFFRQQAENFIKLALMGQSGGAVAPQQALGKKEIVFYERWSGGCIVPMRVRRGR
ncbi:MAG: hypothetical protein DMG05_03185 [Acidobacteria bacterium]|nr:MAG: hypothetical protein DMG05_03185 [Acidobacteriota bacterium]